MGTDLETWQRLDRYAQTLCEARNTPVEFDGEGFGTSLEAPSGAFGSIQLESGIGTSIHYRDDCLAVLFIQQVHQKKAWSEAEKRVMQMVDLSRVLNKALIILDDRIREKQAQIEVQQLGSLMGDAQQLEQLFQNLIDNGLKYQPPGQKPVIKIHSNCLDQTFCDIIVEDNGIGFDPVYAEHIFSPFERLHGKASPYTGTGVGLAISKRIVDRHDGAIQAESRPGQGATFTVRLPYRPDLAQHIPRSKS